MSIKKHNITVKEYNIFIVLFLAGILLSIIHTIFVVLTMGLIAATLYKPFNWLSKRFFNKELNIPSRYGGNENVMWTDWLLFIPFFIASLLPLFTIGEAADCLMETKVWKQLYGMCQ